MTENNFILYFISMFAGLLLAAGLYLQAYQIIFAKNSNHFLARNRFFPLLIKIGSLAILFFVLLKHRSEVLRLCLSFASSAGLSLLMFEVARRRRLR